MSTTPFMGLVIPDAQITSGPLYAQLEVTAFQAIDAHNHGPGSGVLVPSAGLNINGDLSFNSNNLTSLRTLRLATQTSTPVGSGDVGIVYKKNNELAYRDGTGAEVILTSNGSIAGATGTITGLSAPASASFNAVSGLFALQKDASKPGKLAISDINVYEFNNASASAITIKSPASLAAAYTLTLPPAVPTQSAVVSISPTGVLTTGLADGTVSAPGLAFGSELGTGIYRPTTSQVGVAVAGTQRALITAAATTLSTTLSSGALTVTSGGASITGASSVTGSLSVSSGLTVTGALSVSSGLTVSGSLSASSGLTVSGGGASITGALTVSSGLTVSGGGASVAGGLTVTGVTQGPDGSVSTPTMGFTNETNTGFYRSGAGTIGITVGGVQSYSFAAGSLSLLNGTKLSMGDASVSSPSIYFANETGTGIYRSGAGQLAVTVGGVQQAIFNGSGLTLSGGGGIAFTSGGGFFKTAVFSGTLASSASAILTVTGTILSASGFSGVDGVANLPMPSYATGPTPPNSCIAFTAYASTSSVQISNFGAASHTYKVVVIYQ